MGKATKTAYQYSSDHGEYLGTYEVPVCETTGEATLPDGMTFVPPPAGAADHQVEAWHGDRWGFIDNPHALERPPMPDDYSMLMPDFVQWMIDEGLWTEEDEAKYQEEKGNFHDKPGPIQGTP